MTVTLLLAAALVAVADWVAVDQRLVRLEYVLKPLTLVLLIAATLTTDLGDARPWVLAALVFGLLGDIGLVISASEKEPDAPFLAGLAAFLLGHVCYVIGFVQAGVRGPFLVAGLLVVLGVAGRALPAVLRGAAASLGRPFTAVVAAYSAVLAGMTVCAVGTGLILTAIGGVLFLASDTLLAHERFVAPVRRGPLAVIVTYHLAQFLLVLGLVQSF